MPHNNTYSWPADVPCGNKCSDVFCAHQRHKLQACEQLREAKGSRFVQGHVIRKSDGANHKDLGAWWRSGGEEGGESVEESMGHMQLLGHRHTLNQSCEVVQDNNGCVWSARQELYLKSIASLLTS